MFREEIKKEIRYYGFSDKDAEIIREKEGISVIRVQTGRNPQVF